MSLLQLPDFPEQPIYYLPYHVLLNGKHHRILYCKKVLKEVIAGLWGWWNEWRDWFTDETLPLGAWITRV